MWQQSHTLNATDGKLKWPLNDPTCQHYKANHSLMTGNSSWCQLSVSERKSKGKLKFSCENIWSSRNQTWLFFQGWDKIKSIFCGEVIPTLTNVNTFPDWLWTLQWEILLESTAVLSCLTLRPTWTDILLLELSSVRGAITHLCWETWTFWLFPTLTLLWTSMLSVA